MTGPDLKRALWRKSTRSNGNNGNCVEVAFTAATTAVRDSKDPNGPVLTFRPAAVAAFLTTVKHGHFD